VGATLHFASASPLQHCHAECGAADFGFQFYFMCKWLFDEAALHD
jgi:hypothetical protein